MLANIRYRTLAEFGGLKEVNGKVRVPRHAAAMAVSLAESGTRHRMDEITKDRTTHLIRAPPLHQHYRGRW